MSAAKKTSRKALEWSEIAIALGCDVARAKSRVGALGYVVECSRCGGTGHYSFNMMTGTRCFGCDGRKRALMAITPALLIEIQAKIAAGGLVDYFVKAKAKAEARRATKSIKAEIDDKWSNGATHTAYKRERTEKINCSVVCASQLFNGTGLVNWAWGVACEIVRHVEAGTIGAIPAVEMLRECLATIEDANAYAANPVGDLFDAADHIHSVRNESGRFESVQRLIVANPVGW